MINSSLNLISRAKLNWYLSVGPVRPDGFHEVLTVFQELSLGEPMTFTAISQMSCDLIGYPNDIPPDTNLVTRAWRLMSDLFPDKVRGLRVEIDKRLPQGGGLGGGSSNAACTFKAINQLYNLKLCNQQLQEIGSKLGSDVSFFIEGKTALATGRGEILEALNPAPEYWLVLIVPDERMSTAEGYRMLDALPRMEPSPHTMSEFMTALYSGDPHKLAKHLHNDFEIIAEKFKWFNVSAQKLLSAGVVDIILCGSGSTIAGLARSKQHAETIAAQSGGFITSTTF